MVKTIAIPVIPNLFRDLSCNVPILKQVQDDWVNVVDSYFS